MLNALTVDVEDYYQVSAFEHRVARSQWDGRESRVVANTQRLLALFEEFRVRATFFILGWTADRFPDLVREIDARGHEIGSHSYWHRLVYDLTPDEFRADLRQSKEALQSILGRPVTLYRAPSFSITARSLWALDVLVEEGFRADSSIFPVRHDRYGMPEAPPGPHIVEQPAGRLIEFPPGTLELTAWRLPAGGGGYFRLFPLAVTTHAIRKANYGDRPFMFYIHPWEVDPRQPRVDGVGWKSRLRHYVGLSRTETKLRKLLSRFQFGTVSESLRRGAPTLMAGQLEDAIATPHAASLPLRDARVHEPVVA
jgi:polysaccharide deacetylase family protein (PEP-CTERM system associated)